MGTMREKQGHSNEKSRKIYQKGDGVGVVEGSQESVGKTVKFTQEEGAESVTALHKQLKE